jgi:protein-S-isoprenylcysteine O-methyltransferase Ste14/Flp pilus assembly pilin Flp
MGKHVVTFIFALMAAAVARQAVGAIGDAVDEARLETWLVAGYAVLKFAVAVAFTVFVIIRGPALRRARKPVVYLTCAAVIVPAVLRAPSEAASPAVMIAGELIAVLGCGWMLVSALALGRCFGVLPEARGLVTHGPYELVRHPLYLGEFVAVAGLLIASPAPRNLAGGAVFVIAQFTRMSLEERALTREFPEYADYAARTPRVVPSPARVLRPNSAWLLRRLGFLRRRVAPAGESGQAMIEYSLILAFVAAVVVFSLTPLGTGVSDLIAPVAGWF